jgi:cytochrome c biogenesis protein CcdA/thiol-disulfide isomerase/thioredoxin
LRGQAAHSPQWIADARWDGGHFCRCRHLAAVAGGWAVELNQYGRYAAIALLALFGLALLLPRFADRLARPLVALGGRLSEAVDQNAGTPRAAVLPSFVLGVATGLLWAPCAGPILGLILTGAALKGASVETSLLLLSFAAGAATSLALALLVGGQVFALMKRSLGVSEWARRGLGAAVLVAVVAIALGADTGLLTRLSLDSAAPLEQRLLERFRPATGMADARMAPSVVMSGGPAMTGNGPAMTGGDPAMMSGNAAMMGGPAMAGPGGDGTDLSVKGALPPLTGVVEWLNSQPLTQEQLKGKVVLIDFWTYSCINCLRALPYVRAWSEKYKDQGLVVIGVHTPEFAFEKILKNVRSAVTDLKIGYPVAVDNDYAIWRAFGNQYWPAHYFIDTEGQIRHYHFGEGEYDESERVIQKLLAEAGKANVSADLVSVNANGAQAPSDTANVMSPETYLGYERAQNFVSPNGAVPDARSDYSAGAPRLNEWGLSGEWTIYNEHATLEKQGGSIVYRFRARDLHLVLGPAPDGQPIRFQVTIDGAAPGTGRGTASTPAAWAL